MTGRRRILLVKPIMPFPPDQGTRVVSSAIIEALCETCDVTVLARVLDRSEFENVRRLESLCRVVTVFPFNRRHRWARGAYRAAYGIRSFFTGRSLKSLYDCPGPFVREARRLADERFDVVIVEYWQLYPLLRVFDPNVTVLLTHDIDFSVNADRLLLEGNLFRKAAALRKWRIERREELRAYRRARHIWALTKRDAAAAKELSRGAAVTSVLPFGLEEARFVPTITRRESREVLFMGALAADFNRDALDHFARDIHPLLAGIEGIHFTVVGGQLPESLAFFGKFRNVEVVGHTPDVTPFLERCACLVVPLRFGGGLRIRILEAMAAGVPVVASPVSIEGMGLEPGEHVLVARTPAEYRDHIQALFDYPAEGKSLARRAQSHVHETYGPAARSAGIRAAVEALVRPR